MPKRDWTQARQEYLRGKISLRDIATKYGVSFSSVYRVSKKEKWTEKRKKTKDKIDAKEINKIANQETRKSDIFEDISNKLLLLIKDTIENGDILALGGRGLRDITGALKDIKDIKGLKSEIDLQEQMARIEKLRKDAKETQESRDVNVIISDGLDEYSY